MRELASAMVSLGDATILCMNGRYIFSKKLKLYSMQIHKVKAAPPPYIQVIHNG